MVIKQKKMMAITSNEGDVNGGKRKRMQNNQNETKEANQCEQQY